MKILRRCFFLVAALAAVSVLQTSAMADCGGCGGSGAYHGFGYGYGLNSSAYATGRIPTPPYFAIHPPVYYSAPVPRTYGYSPYAYPDSVRTPEIEVTNNVAVMQNPYYQENGSKKAKAKTASNAAMTQLTVVNPFFSDQNKTTLAAYND